MKISVISPSEIDSAARARWMELQRSNPALASPYFCPEFTLSVAAVRQDVRIAVLEEGGGVLGFFPYQARWRLGSPVGGQFSDHHGVIAAPGTEWDWAQLLQATSLASWRFDHLAASQSPAVPLRQTHSPAIDLSGGFAAYQRERRSAGSKQLVKTERKAQKLAAELGPLRYVEHAGDDAVFRMVLRLKGQKFRDSGLPDPFLQPWVRGMLERIRATDTPYFAGRLSALYAGQTLVAAHLGMRSERIWHYWLPVYDHAYAKLSPGLQLLLHIAQAGAGQGRQLLDLGKGGEEFKLLFANCSLPLVEGCLTRPGFMTALQKVRHEADHWRRTSPILQPLRPIVRSVRHLKIVRTFIRAVQ